MISKYQQGACREQQPGTLLSCITHTRGKKIHIKKHDTRHHCRYDIQEQRQREDGDTRQDKNHDYRFFHRSMNNTLQKDIKIF